MSDHQLTLGEHLQELRRRLLISVAAVIAGSAASFYFVPQIIELLKRPVQDLNDGAGIELHFFAVAEGFASIIKVSFFAGFILAFPIILYQAIRFVAPGLSGKEKRYLFAFLPEKNSPFRYCSFPEGGAP